MQHRHLSPGVLVDDVPEPVDHIAERGLHQRRHLAAVLLAGEPRLDERDDLLLGGALGLLQGKVVRMVRTVMEVVVRMVTPAMARAGTCMRAWKTICQGSGRFL